MPAPRHAAMCYPSDHYDGSFIANWALWLVLELEEYKTRSGDEQMISAYKEKVYALMAYMAGLENSDGLLEKVPGWGVCGMVQGQ